MSRKPQFPRPAQRPAGDPTSPADDESFAALEFLGLPGGATADQIDAAHDELVGFLAGAPRPLWAWARGQAALADEALVTLTDPTARRSPGALSGSTRRSADLPDGPATPPVRRALPSAGTAGSADAHGGADDGPDDFESMLADVTPSLHRESLPAGRAGDRPAAARPAAALRSSVPAAGPRGIPRFVIAGISVLVIAAAAFGIYKLGEVPGTGAIPSVAPSQGGLDEALVASLMGKLQTDPNDKDALMGLGNAFFKAGDYTTSITWFEKLIAIDPENVQALLALGAANFNLGQADPAEKLWLSVVAIDPKNVEARYDLGFLYFNAEPMNVAGVQAQWGEVIKIDPTSDIAKIVKAHLDSITPTTSGSPAPSSAPSAAPSSGASPAPSAAETPEASK